MVSVHLSALIPLSSPGPGTNISPPSLPEQMQELEQRLLEAEQRAENAETQVTLHGALRESAGENVLPFPRSHGHTLKNLQLQVGLKHIKVLGAFCANEGDSV